MTTGVKNGFERDLLIRIDAMIEVFAQIAENLEELVKLQRQLNEAFEREPVLDLHPDDRVGEGDLAARFLAAKVGSMSMVPAVSTHGKLNEAAEAPRDDPGPIARG